jgi:Alpha/beta hydrolase
MCNLDAVFYRRSMPTFGANLDNMRGAAREFNDGSFQLLRSSEIVTALLSETFWLGPAATTFNDEWRSVHALSLRDVATSLATCSTTLTRNLTEQIEASRADGSGTSARFGAATMAASGISGVIGAAGVTGAVGSTGASGPTGSANPTAALVAQNRRQMETELANGIGDTELLKKLLDGNVQVLLWDPKHGRIATVQGDVATADYVVITVPGTGTVIGQYTADGKETQRARQIFDAAALDGKKTAVIAWLGYDAPKISLTDRSPADESMAIQGGKNLVNFVKSLGLHDDQSLGVLGHSYGSTVAGHAAVDGLVINNLVLIGSPGVGVDSASDLRLPKGSDVFAMRLELDPIGGLNAFGTDPASLMFGAKRLDGSTDALFAHSDYWNQKNLPQLVGALTDGKTHTVIGPQTLGEAVVAPGQIIDNLENRAVDQVQRIVPAPLDPAIDFAQSNIRKANGIVNTAVTEVVDGTVEVGEKVAGAVADTVTDVATGTVDVVKSGVREFTNHLPHFGG